MLEGSKSAASPGWAKPLNGVLAVALPCGLGTLCVSKLQVDRILFVRGGKRRLILRATNVGNNHLRDGVWPCTCIVCTPPCDARHVKHVDAFSLRIAWPLLKIERIGPTHRQHSSRSDPVAGVSESGVISLICFGPLKRRERKYVDIVEVLIFHAAAAVQITIKYKTSGRATCNRLKGYIAHMLWLDPSGADARARQVSRRPRGTSPFAVCLYQTPSGVLLLYMDPMSNISMSAIDNY